MYNLFAIDYWLLKVAMQTSFFDPNFFEHIDMAVAMSEGLLSIQNYEELYVVG